MSLGIWWGVVGSDEMSTISTGQVLPRSMARAGEGKVLTSPSGCGAKAPIAAVGNILLMFKTATM